MDDQYIILVIDDDENIIVLLRDFLAKQGYQVDSAATGEEAIEKLKTHIYDLVLIDLNLPDKNGIEIVKWIKDHTPDTIPVILSGYATLEITLEAISYGAFDFLIKPVQLTRLNIVVENGLERRKIILQNKKLISELQIAKKNLEASVRQRTRQLRKSEQKFRALYDNAPDVYYTVNPKGELIDGNKMACEFFGYTKKELLGKHLLDLYSEEHFELVAAMIPSLDGVGHSVRNKELQVKRSDGTLVDVEINTNILFEKKGEVIGALILQRDISERKKAEREKDCLLRKLHELNKQLENLAITDGLTGLYNHRFFMEALVHEFSRSKRNKTPLGCLMIDIDNFKKFNDSYGHQLGDDILSKLAQILRSSRRGTDIVARYGGEEFVLLLPDTNLERAYLLAENLRRKVDKTSIDSEQGKLKVNISIGVHAMEDDNLADPSMLLKMADQALYLAKQRGKNRVCKLEDAKSR